MIEVTNTTSVNLKAGEVIPFTTVVYNTDENDTTLVNGNTININKIGYHKCGGNFIFAPTTSGTYSISMYVNGNIIPTATSEFQTTEDGQVVTFSIPSKYLKILPTTIGNTVSVTFVTSGDGILTMANAFVAKVPSTLNIYE